MGEKIQRCLRRIVRNDGNEHQNDAQTMTSNDDDGKAYDGIRSIQGICIGESIGWIIYLYQKI